MGPVDDSGKDQALSSYLETISYMHQSEYQNIYSSEEKHFYYVGMHKEILSIVEKYFPKRISGKRAQILDAGCGTGLLAKKLEEYGDVQGIDISEEAVKFSKSRGVEVINAPVEKIPFKKNFFDLIVSVDVLYHRDVDEQKALEEFWRVLKPEGLLIFKLPAFTFLKGKHDIVVHAARRYSKSSLLFKLTEIGFQEIRSTYLASFLFLPAFIKRTVEKFFVLDKEVVESDVQMPLWIINKLLIFFFVMENFVLKFVNLPLGLSVLAVVKKQSR